MGSAVKVVFEGFTRDTGGGNSELNLAIEIMQLIIATIIMYLMFYT